MRDTYVDGPISFLHVVCGEEVGHAGELVEEVVLEAEEGRRSDDGCFGEYASDDFFAAGLVFDCELRERDIVDLRYLCSVEFGRRILAGVEGRDMNEAIDVVFCNSFCYSLGTFDMHVFKGKISVVL